MTIFTYKYAPKSSSQVFGQDKALDQIKEFLNNFKTSKQKAALLYGPIGTGKTSSIYALVKELDLDILEINSSDLRNKNAIGSFLKSALGQQSLFFKPKVVLIDELDNLSGMKDRGGLSEVAKMIDKSSFPIIITANEIFDSKFTALRKKCKLIEFHKLQYRTIAHALQWVAEQEGINVEEKAINSLARQADGDMRAALLDLQVLGAIDKNLTFEKVTKLSARKRTETIFNALSLVFKSSSAENALGAYNDVDLDPGKIFLWLDENLPREYLTASSLAKSYEVMARANIFNNRIRRRQHWRFLVYVYSLLSAGISVSKDERNPSFISYQKPTRILKLWQAKMKYAKKKEIAAKLALATHTSSKVALQNIHYLQNIFRRSAGDDIATDLELSTEEVDWLKR